MKKDLLPRGGRKNLKAPMPRSTKYVGESYFAWDIKNRYAEHMDRQRRKAAADAAAPPRQDGDDHASGRRS